MRFPWMVTAFQPSSVHCPVAELLVVLLRASGGRIALVEGIGEADAIQRHLFHALHFLQELGAGHVQRRGHEVSDVGVLIPDLALALDPLGPGDDQRIGDAAVVDNLLAILEGSVPRHGPTRVIVRIGVGAAPFLVMLHILLKGSLHAVENERFVIQSVQAALATGNHCRR